MIVQSTQSSQEGRDLGSGDQEVRNLMDWNWSLEACQRTKKIVHLTVRFIRRSMLLYLCEFFELGIQKLMMRKAEF